MELKGQDLPEEG